MANITSTSLSSRSIYNASVYYIIFFFFKFYLSISSGIASKNIYLYGDGRVLLDNFSNCISMISPCDGKLRRQIYDYTDQLKDQILYLGPEVVYQVCLND